MKTSITNKELRGFLNTDLIIVEADRSSLLIDTDAFYIDASITRLTSVFEVSAYLGEVEIDFTEYQENVIANILEVAEQKEDVNSLGSVFGFNDQLHALSLIF